jgi:prepilin-type N-terminal cleavage/methylation domain-containing protein
VKARRASSAAGYTLLEVVIALVIFLIVGLTSYEALAVTSRVAMHTSQTSELDQRAHRVVTRILRELQEARVESFVPEPVPPWGSAALSYQAAEISADNTIVWGAYRRLELVQSATDPKDGIDNDRDGLVDEHELRLVRDAGLPTEYATVLATDVSPLLEGEEANAADDNNNGLLDEPGFCVCLREGVLEVRLSLQGPAPNREVETRTVEMTIWPRN